MSEDEVKKIFELNHETILEKLKKLHHTSGDCDVIAEISDKMRENKLLFDNMYDDRNYCINTVKQFTGEFEAVGGD